MNSNWVSLLPCCNKPINTWLKGETLYEIGSIYRWAKITCPHCGCENTHMYTDGRALRSCEREYEFDRNKLKFLPTPRYIRGY